MARSAQSSPLTSRTMAYASAAPRQFVPPHTARALLLQHKSDSSQTPEGHRTRTEGATRISHSSPCPMSGRVATTGELARTSAIPNARAHARTTVRAATSSNRAATQCQCSPPLRSVARRLIFPCYLRHHYRCQMLRALPGEQPFFRQSCQAGSWAESVPISSRPQTKWPLAWLPRQACRMRVHA